MVIDDGRAVMNTRGGKGGRQYLLDMAEMLDI